MTSGLDLAHVGATARGVTDDALPGGLETDLQIARISKGLFEGNLQPARLGRFVVLERIGSGAMGTVFRAYDPQLDRSVAIKVLRTQAAERDPDALINAPEVASKLAPALAVDLYLAVAQATAQTDPEASKAWAQEALSALKDTDGSYDADRQLARSLAGPS